MAQALGDGFLKHGHEVMLGTRELLKLEDWAAKNHATQIGDFATTAALGELVVVAVKGLVAAEALRAAGEDSFSGKPVIDATNPRYVDGVSEPVQFRCFA